MRAKKRGHKVLLTSWLFSYGLILLLPIIAWFVSLWQYNQVLRSQMDELNMSMLESMRSQYEGELMSVMANSYYLFLDGGIAQTAGAQDPYALDIAARSPQIRDTLADFVAKNSICELAYIYFCRSDCVISSETKASAPLYFAMEYTQQYNKAYRMDETTWRRALNSVTRRGFVRWPALRGGDSILYLLPDHTVQELGGADAVLCLTLSSARVLEIAGRFAGSSEAIVALYNDSGMLLATNYPGDFSEFSGAGYRMNEIVSEPLGWVLRSYVPQDLYSERTDVVWRVATAALMLSLAACAAIIFFSVRANYNPIRDLIAQLERHTAKRRDMGELEYLRRAIDSIIQTSTQTSALLKSHAQRLERAYARRLLLGSEEMETGLQAGEYLSMLGFDDSTDAFAVLLLAGGEPDALLAALSPLVNPQDTAGSVFFGYCVALDGRIAALLELTGVSWDDYQTGVAGIGGALAGQFPAAALAASRIHDSAAGISSAYDEALYALEFLLEAGQSPVVFYRQPDGPPKGALAFSGEQERRLIYLAAAGDEAGAAQLVEQIWAEGSAAAPEMAKPLLADLFCALLKTPQRDQTLGAYVEKQMLSLRRLSAGQLRDALFEAVQLACRHSPRPDQDESDQLRGMVLAYIEENYADPDLCVQRICQHVGRARSSVFALFGGQNAGDSLLGAISRTRVEAAKTLLETSALGVHEIGIQVGYLNVNTFLRVFKKYEGVTPGQYRQMTANRQPEKAQPPLTQ